MKQGETTCTNEVEIPQTIFELIGEYEGSRLDGVDSLRSLVLSTRKGYAMRSNQRMNLAMTETKFRKHAQGDIDSGLMRHSDYKKYCGGLTLTDVQHASLYELLLQSKSNIDQMPETILFEGVEYRFRPTFEPFSLIDMTIAPVSEHIMLLATDGRFRLNPWTSHYLVRQVGDERVLNGSGEKTVVRNHRRVILNLKAYWFAVLISGSLPNALAQSIGDKLISRHTKLFGVLADHLLSFIDRVGRLVTYLLASVSFEWYVGMSDEAKAAGELILVGLTVLWLYRRSTFEHTLVVPKVKQADRFLGQLLGEKGMEYRVRVNGREFVLSADEEIYLHQDEMAMPNSEYFPCRAQPIGAILITTDDKDVQVFGVFWRLDDYLVTARHCSNTLYIATSKIYLASIKPTKKGNFEIDRSNMFRADDKFFSPENNVIASFDVDAFATELTPAQWSSVRLMKAATRMRSRYELQVQSHGFTSDGLLVAASGKTLPDSGYENLHHTASTQKGFSGSILTCGGSVVGMHVSAAGDHNVAIRREYIEYLIDKGTGLESNSKNRKKYTYADASYKEAYRQNKWRGGVADLKQMRDGKFAIVLDNGEATFGWDLKGLVECFGLTGDSRRDEDYFEDMIMDTRSKGRHVTFDDDRYRRNENASVAVGKVKRKPQSKKKAEAKRSPVSKSFTVEEGLKPVHGPSVPIPRPEAVQALEGLKERVKDLGYEEGAFEYPQMTPQDERKSLEKHLELYAKRVGSIKHNPTDSEKKRSAGLVASMLQPASFIPDEHYNRVEGVTDIIHSSIINPGKASGYPYCSQGMPLNKQVLDTFGVQGFAQHVVNEWHKERIEGKVIIKGEPTKRKKLANGMPRIVVNLPVDTTVKHASVFKNLSINLVKQWKKIPVKYAFAPGNPGHIEHLASCIPGPVWESDKTNWDYMMFPWVADVTRDVVKHLAVRHPKWDDAQFAGYLADVDGCFEDIFEKTVYRTSDGAVYTPKSSGIMKSGWFFTIGGNSIAQLATHVMTCIHLGLSDEEILALSIVAGGDDVNQEPVPGGVDKYVASAADLGIEMEIHERESMYHAEYFSSDLRMGADGPEYYPKRWTKHIEHLKVIKLEDLADALCSHMENYRHDKQKFMFLEDMYHSLRDKHPSEFPVSKLVSRTLLLAKQYGYEHALC